LVRALPFGLNSYMAAAVMGANRWDAGVALMQAGNPDRWTQLTVDTNLIAANRDKIAACRMTLGAQGVWTGSVWLPTVESDIAQPLKERILAARSRDTIRSRALSGKPARQLKSAWSDAWESADSPGCLPMPFQSLLADASQTQILRSVESGNAAARSLLTEGVGQGVGMLNEVKSARTVVQEFKQDFADAIERMQEILA
jgi:NAD(P)H-dependent flavin oxidoreductase YrpB (nitropropane dioxygenase family)